MSRLFSRRAFLAALASLSAAAFRPPPLPGAAGARGERHASGPRAANPQPGAAPRAGGPRAPGRPVFFVPAADYHELPAGCYAENVIPPGELILHWDGNRHGRELWKVAITYETLAYVQQSAHFAVDDQRVWQLLPMYRALVQESYGAQGYNRIAINIEMAGRDFDLPEFAPGENQVRLTMRLVSQLMDYYAIPFEKVVGHFERDDRGLKRDPGAQFLAGFREQLAAYRATLSPLKQRFLAEP